MSDKPRVLFRVQKNAVVAALLAGMLLSVCMLRLYATRTESVEAMAGESAERIPQSLFGLLAKQMEED